MPALVWFANAREQQPLVWCQCWLPNPGWKLKVRWKNRGRFVREVDRYDRWRTFLQCSGKAAFLFSGGPAVATFWGMVLFAEVSLFDTNDADFPRAQANHRTLWDDSKKERQDAYDD